MYATPATFMWLLALAHTITSGTGFAAAQQLVTNFTIDGVSPLQSIGNLWSYDEKTFFRTLPERLSTTTSFQASFVGNHFQLLGRVLPPANDGIQCSVNGRPPVELPVLQGDDTELVSETQKDNSIYRLEVDLSPETSMEFHHIRFNMSITTEAPTWEILESKGTKVTALRNGVINPLMMPSRFSSEDVINDAGADLPQEAKYSLSDGQTVVLEQMSEIQYAVEKNMSLIHVRGPVRMERENLSVCAAVLEPRPSWWDETAGPTVAWEAGPLNISFKALFILPIDPTVRYTLKIMPRYPDTVCSVSELTTFPYFYKDRSNHENPTNGNPTNEDPTDEDPTNENRINGSTAPSSDNGAATGNKEVPASTIAGAVVGGVALIIVVIVLIVWITRRHVLRQQQSLRVAPPDEFVVDVTDGPDSILTPYTNRPSEGSTAPDGHGHSSPGAAGSHRGRRAQRQAKGPVIVQEEDAEDIDTEDQAVKFLPPKYRPAWRQTTVVESDSTSPTTRTVKQVSRTKAKE